MMQGICKRFRLPVIVVGMDERLCGKLKAHEINQYGEWKEFHAAKMRSFSVIQFTILDTNNLIKKMQVKREVTAKIRGVLWTSSA
jgi:hypothetical protein